MTQQVPSIENPAKYEISSLFHGQILSYMVGFYIFAFYLELHLRFPILQSIRFQFTYGAIVGALCLFKQLNAPGPSAPVNGVTKSAFLLLSILGIYTIYSFDREQSLIIFNDRSVKYALIAFFIYSATEKIEDLRVIFAFILLAWLKLCQEGFIGWATGGLMWENQGIMRLHGSTAMYGHPNSFSGFAVGCLPFAALFLLSTKNILFKLGFAIIIFCCLIIIVNTGSRTGYVGVIAGSVYIFSQLKTSKFKIFLLAMITTLIAVNVVPDQYKERFESIFSGQEKAGHSSERRAEIIEDALIIYSEHPMGIGVHAFPKVRGERFGRYQDTHNLYLEILTNIGPFGFIVFFVFIIQLVQKNRHNITIINTLPPENELNNNFLMTMSKATIGFILIRLVLGLFGMDLYEIYWWVALGLTLAVTKLLHKHKASKLYSLSR